MALTGMAYVLSMITKLVMPVSLMELLAIPRGNLKTFAKWLVISQSLSRMKPPLSNSPLHAGERTDVKSNLQFWGEGDKVLLREFYI